MLKEVEEAKKDIVEISKEKDSVVTLFVVSKEVGEVENNYTVKEFVNLKKFPVKENKKYVQLSLIVDSEETEVGPQLDFESLAEYEKAIKEVQAILA